MLEWFCIISSVILFSAPFILVAIHVFFTIWDSYPLNILKAWRYGGSVRKHIDFKTGKVRYNTSPIFRMDGSGMPESFFLKHCK